MRNKFDEQLEILNVELIKMGALCEDCLLYTSTIRNIDDAREEKDKLLDLAQRDSLTRIYNAKTCRSLITKRISELKDGEICGFVLLDIDHFKSINDTYGHMVGDEVLKSVSELLCKIIDADDIVGRPGGDEFVVFVKDITSREKLSEICADICNRVHEVKAEDCAITLSAGAVLVYKSQTYGEIYQAADKLLYEAKSNGRDGYAVSDFNAI